MYIKYCLLRVCEKYKFRKYICKVKPKTTVNARHMKRKAKNATKTNEL